MNRYDQRVKELGGKPSYRLNIRRPIALSEAELVALEHELGWLLPADYREFLRDFGGFSFDDFEFYGVMPGEVLDLLEWHQFYYQRDVMPAELMPIAIGGGGNNLCIAVSGQNRGAIYFWIMEEATMPGSYDNTKFVANSFDALMQSDYLRV